MMVIVSFTESNTMMSVGRTMIASGMPSRSGLIAGKCSTWRTMS